MIFSDGNEGEAGVAARCRAEGKAVGREIESLIPHRAPFRFVDRVELDETDRDKVRGERLFKDEFFFQGHFPGQPVVPGVILVETLAQCGGIGAKLAGVDERGTFLFAKIVSARFRRPVRPGERLDMEIENLRATASIIHQRGKGSVGGELAVEAEWISIAAPLDEGAASASAASGEGEKS
jgi:3-hydroxyacyl-[acyl-carrier-protein] dehydratase